MKNKNWVKWANMAFIPAYIVAVALTTWMSYNTGIGRNDGTGSLFFYGLHLLAWVALCWITRHIDPLLYKIALTIPLIVAVWDFVGMWILVRIIPDYAAYFAMPMSIWVCLAVMVGFNAWHLHHNAVASDAAAEPTAAVGHAPEPSAPSDQAAP